MSRVFSADRLRERVRFGSVVWPVIAWLCAITVTAVCVGIIVYLFQQGSQTVNMHFLTHDPNPSMTEAQTGACASRSPVRSSSSC